MLLSLVLAGEVDVADEFLFGGGDDMRRYLPHGAGGGRIFSTCLSIATYPRHDDASCVLAPSFVTAVSPVFCPPSQHLPLNTLSALRRGELAEAYKMFALMPDVQTGLAFLRP